MRSGQPVQSHPQTRAPHGRSEGLAPAQSPVPVSVPGKINATSTRINCAYYGAARNNLAEDYEARPCCSW